MKLRNSTFDGLKEWIKYFGSFNKNNYKLWVIHIAIEEFIRQLAIEWKERGTLFAKLWRLYEIEVIHKFQTLMQISENRYKVMLNKFKEQAEKLEVLEMENEKYVNEIINQNVVIMKQSDIINATSELLYLKKLK